MAAIFRGDGSQIEVVTPADGVIEGQIVAIGNLIGIASATRDEGTNLILQRTGTYTLPKIAADTYAAGDAVYYDAASGKASAQTGELPLLGYVVADAPEDNTEALVVLAYAQPPASGGGAAYTEISFTWYQVGTSAPVIVNQGSSPDVVITPGYEEPGYFVFNFPAATFPDRQKCEILGADFVVGNSTRAIVAQIASDSSIFIYARDPLSAFALANDVGLEDGVQGVYANTVIRIYP